MSSLTLLSDGTTSLAGQQGHTTVTRAELIEIQRASHGRKYTTVDRRPLDPPPVVQLKLYETITDPETRQVVEREISDFNDGRVWMGYVCTLDLFPVTEQQAGPSHGPVLHIATAGSAQQSHDGTHRFQDAENSKMTEYLVGQKEVQAHVVEYRGQNVLVFVFADLSVKAEGDFLFRYRAFDLCSPTLGMVEGSPGSIHPLRAECYGGTFRVYSTKDFPGLQASTELTKHLGLWGVRLTVRATERRREQREPSAADRPLYTTQPMKRKWQGQDDEEDDDDEELV